jgi:predicted TPR repeat methyltransferase
MRSICILAFGVCILFLAACRDTASTVETREARDQRIKQAHALEVAGRTNEAMEAYESVLRVDPDNGLAALGFAMLLQEQTKDFTNMLKSAYWYQRYLETRPDAEKKHLIENRIQIVSRHLATAIVKSAPQAAPAPVPVPIAEVPARVQPAPVRPAQAST